MWCIVHVFYNVFAVLKHFLQLYIVYRRKTRVVPDIRCKHYNIIHFRFVMFWVTHLNVLNSLTVTAVLLWIDIFDIYCDFL